MKPIILINDQSPIVKGSCDIHGFDVILYQDRMVCQKEDVLLQAVPEAWFQVHAVQVSMEGEYVEKKCGSL